MDSKLIELLEKELLLLETSSQQEDEIKEGALSLWKFYIQKTDFATAPASTKYHSNFEGGLLQHSAKVYHVLKKLNSKLSLAIPPISLFIAGIFHDLCKVGLYEVSFRNAKNDETGKWEKVPYYSYTSQPSTGHGEESVIRILSFIPRLPQEVILAIRFHMGAYESITPQLSNALSSSHLVLALQTADLMSTYWLEGELETPSELLVPEFEAL